MIAEQHVRARIRRLTGVPFGRMSSFEDLNQSLAAIADFQRREVLLHTTDLLLPRDILRDVARQKNVRSASAEAEETNPASRQSPGNRVDRMRIRAAWMYYVEQMTQNDIADVLGVGRVTVVRMTGLPVNLE